MTNSLNTEVVLTRDGGSGARDMFIDKPREQLQIRAYRKPAERAKLIRSKLGDDAGILGAAFLGF